MRFDRIAILDWSASAIPSPRRPSADAIWIGVAARDGLSSTYHRTRAGAMAFLHALVTQTLAANQRLLIGADFPFGYPAGFATAMTAQPAALALWDRLAARIEDGPDNRNNRFALADRINAGFPGVGPFWGRPASLDLAHLPDKGRARHGHPFPERRVVEARVPSAQPCWKLYTTGSVGSQALLGIPALARLRAAFPRQIAVWPFEAPDAAIVLAEVYPSLLAPQVARLTGPGPRGRHDWPIKDAVQVRLLAAALADLSASGDLAPGFAPDAPPQVLTEEGWILGVGIEAALIAAAARVGQAALPPAP